MVKTRFAPSPTGFLHVGSARTALFSYLYARKHQGEFILRIEDTDSERSDAKTTDEILNDLQWLGLNHDTKPFYQSQRKDYYYKAVERLFDLGLAYRCYCTREELDHLRQQQRAKGEKPRYDGRCRNRTSPPAGRADDIKPVVRFKTPETGSISFDDLVYGHIETSNLELDDLVLLRADGSPTYNLAVVVDDADMGITHVIRGDDHLNNTPKQIHILQALGLELPYYAHLPMILNQDGSRMSKRRGATSIGEYRREGYLPQAILNYLVRLGWSHGNQEIFSFDEMIDLFKLEEVNVSAASLNSEKLRWLNQHYLKELPSHQLLASFKQQLSVAGFSDYEESAQSVFEVLCTRYKTLKEMAEGAAFVYSGTSQVLDSVKASRVLNEQTKVWLEALLGKLKQLDPWTDASIRETIDATCTAFDIKLSQLGPSLRFATTYGMMSPELPKTLVLIGREQCVERLSNSLQWIDASKR